MHYKINCNGSRS